MIELYVADTKPLNDDLTLLAFRRAAEREGGKIGMVTKKEEQQDGETFYMTTAQVING